MVPDLLISIVVIAIGAAVVLFRRTLAGWRAWWSKGFVKQSRVDAAQRYNEAFFGVTGLFFIAVGIWVFVAELRTS